MALVITLLIAGLVLLALEVVLPGLVAGAAGLLCLLGGVILAYRDHGIVTGHITLMTVIALLVAGFFAWLRFFPTSRLGRRFVSDSQVGEIRAEQPDLVGQEGTAVTTLRPSGTALIDGRRVDVVTEGAMVERGSPLRVVAVEGLRVVVRAVER